jgi:Ca-activated chloride channel family protein
MSWDAIAELARSGRGADESGYRSEFVQLVKAAAGLK